MASVVPAIHDWVVATVPLLDALLIGVSGLGSGWFVALAFGVAGLLVLARRRTDLALVLAARTLAYWAAIILIGAISLIRVYLGAHYPMDVLGGWMGGAALTAVIVAVHILVADDRTRGEHRPRVPR